MDCVTYSGNTSMEVTEMIGDTGKADEVLGEESEKIQSKPDESQMSLTQNDQEAAEILEASPFLHQKQIMTSSFTNFSIQEILKPKFATAIRNTAGDSDNIQHTLEHSNCFKTGLHGLSVSSKGVATLKDTDYLSSEERSAKHNPSLLFKFDYFANYIQHLGNNGILHLSYIDHRWETRLHECVTRAHGSGTGKVHCTDAMMTQQTDTYMAKTISSIKTNNGEKTNNKGEISNNDSAKPHNTSKHLDHSKTGMTERNESQEPVTSLVASTSGSGLSPSKTETKPSKDWPAWVYCTRYSDRPSAGPRSRKNRRQVKIPDGKRPRTAFSNEQLKILRSEFESSKYLTENRRRELAQTLHLSEAQIKIWYQNKRAKIKKTSGGYNNPLALQLRAQGLYNHDTLGSKEAC